MSRRKPVLGKSRCVLVRIPVGHIEGLDVLVRKGFYANRNWVHRVHRVYYVHEGFMRWCRLAYVRGIGFLDVKGCVKFFGAVFRGVFAWEKSMLSALGFLIVVSPDCGRYLFGVVDGGVFLG